MPFKDFTVGEILTSADVDLYLMSQVIIRCTSATRPGSPAQGWHIYETDTRRFMVYNGSAWVLEGLHARHALKTSDQTVNNTGTLQDDSQLFLSVDANTSYIVDSWIFYNSNGTADFRMGWSAPAGSSFMWGGRGQDTNTGGSVAGVDYAVRSLSFSTDSAGFVGDMLVRPTGILTVGGTAGTLRFRWAQNTPDASNTVVRTNSVVRLTLL